MATERPAGPLPAVSVLVATRDREELLAETLRAILDQDYPGRLDVLIVYDGVEPDTGHEQERPERRVRVTANTRKPGLSGARNTGILAAEHDFVAYCDDDDVWAPGKLTAQVRRLLAEPRTPMCATGIMVDFRGRLSPRRAGSPSVTHEALLASRMSMLHSSTFVLRRAALLGPLGLMDEELPASHNEDWDLLLRASALAPVAVVDQPLVRVRWGSTSFYNRHWDLKIASLQAMLERHPDLVRNDVGAARVYGQIAFAHASAGRRRAALTWAGRALRRRPREWRAGAALLVATGLVGGGRVLDVLHRFGRGV
jgi:glycosyltransferase involved in cell wall biosynthesis